MDLQDKKWDKLKIIKFIKLYEENTLLWDTNDINYRHKIKKAEAIQKIAKILDSNYEEIMKKLNTLLTQYRREKTILNKSHVDRMKVPWFAYEHFQFLDKVQSRRGNVIAKFAEHLSKNDILSDDENSKVVEVEIKNRIDTNELREADASTETKTVFTPKPLLKVRHKSLLNHKPLHKSLRGHNRTRDDIEIFTEMIAQKLRSFKDKRKVCILKHQIETLLYNAELAEFDSVEEDSRKYNQSPSQSMQII